MGEETPRRSSTRKPHNRKHSSTHYIRSVLRQVWEHPSNTGRRLRATVRAMSWQAYKRVARRPIMISFGPYRVRCHPDNGSAANVIYFTERFDPVEFSFLERYLRDGDNVVDAGANIGLYSLWCAQFVGPTGSIEAFEAAPKTAARMRENLATNALSDIITLHEVAVAAEQGRMDFYTDFDVSNGLVPDGAAAHPRSRTVSVECVALDAAVPSHRFSLGKLDVEGAEALALEGWAMRLAAGDPPVVLLELLPNQLKRCGSSVASVIRQLDDLGYGLFQFDTQSAALSPIEAPLQVRGNVLAVHLGSLEEIIDRLRRD